MADLNAPITFDVTNVEAWDGTKSFSDLPAGAYKARTKAAGPHEAKSSGKLSYAVEVETDVGSTTIYLGLDFTKEANAKKLRTALASVGLKPAGMKGNLSPAHFLGPDGKGRPCYIIVKEVDGLDAQGRKKLNDKEFLTPEQFAAYTTSNGSTAPSTASAPAAAGGTPDSVANLFT